jgi:succinoglycan biosynthesis transport protein ExoP
MWPIIVAVALVSAGTAYIWAKHKPKQYSATSALLFQDSQLDQRLFGNQAIGSSSDPTRQAATNLALVGLPTVARLVAQQLKIPTSQVLSDISIGSDSQSDVLTVTATDHDPAVAAGLANAYTQQYIAFRQTADRSQLTQAENTAKSQLAAIAPSQRNSALAQSLQSRSYELGLLASLQTGNAEVVQTATPPTSPSSPNPPRDGVIGLILGLVIGGAVVFALERRDRRIKSIAEIEELYGVPIIGTVPESAALGAPGAIGTPREQDAFRMIRAQLRYFDVDRDIRRVLVTSADSGEGKSLISLNLARAAGQAGNKRALLIEADLRRPSLTAMIGLESVAGLSELLSHSQDLASGLRELVIAAESSDDSGRSVQFDVLLAGATPPNPVELLESTRMVELMSYADSMYDIVIIDTPPIGVVSDPISLVHQVDGVLVVSRLGHSRRDQASRLMKQLRGLNAHVLGVVVNGFQSSATGYYGYYRDLSDGDGKPPRGGWRGRQRQVAAKRR